MVEDTKGLVLMQLLALFEVGRWMNRSNFGLVRFLVPLSSFETVEPTSRLRTRAVFGNSSFENNQSRRSFYLIKGIDDVRK